MLTARYVIIGNSGAGKSTLARRLGDALDAAPIDLDDVYWEPDAPGVARPQTTAREILSTRVGERERWVVEGCYEVLAEGLLPLRPTLLWLDPGETACLEHCRRRPWEPHKYPTPQAQDANLAMLLDWVRQHYQHAGAMSYARHRKLFDGYDGHKLHLHSDCPLEEVEGALG